MQADPAPLRLSSGISVQQPVFWPHLSFRRGFQDEAWYFIHNPSLPKLNDLPYFDF